ncbi:hypothetical protein [uncultured Maribacter sp.]|uniref:hypothetical protein n=1 Tax=uncultured Maribacter sp. TaxID=431308 RepID=UPI0026230B7F|nr:hypothetical protein [uncultured Maribacter sp.]
MKNIIFFLGLFILFNFSCKTDKKQKEITPKEVVPSIPEKIAYASGFKNWEKVKEIQFSFNVDRDTSHFERKWIWNTRKNKVTRIIKSDTVSYKRNTLDSISTKINGGFINDKFWLLAPFNLVWDSKNYTYTHSESSISPLAKEELQKLTIVYGNKGGYTPGDAYDFYFDQGYKIKEWVFRKGNQEEPSMTTTWEDYLIEHGIHIAKMHKKEGDNFKLYFTDLKILVD